MLQAQAQAISEQESSAKVSIKVAEDIAWARTALFLPYQGNYRSHRLPAYLHNVLNYASDYRTPFGRSVKSQLRREWAEADRIERRDRQVASRQEYLPAEEQEAFWRDAGMVWRQEMSEPSLVEGQV